MKHETTCPCRTRQSQFTLAIPFLVALTLGFNVSALAAGNHAGGHGHEQTSSEIHNSGDHHGGGHGKSAVGAPGKPQAVTRTLSVDLLDSMRFDFDQPLALKRGDVVRFIVTNKGRIRHEFSIGNQAEQDAHRVIMRGMPDMVHDDPNAVTVDPGQTKTLLWRFDGKDDVVFACNIPGHSEAGMVTKTMLK